ncbi:VanZ family protein [Mucisphaera sp.]|uniref:VanZ family protein n=1 Tax=Mucisphaera sp. TaxID=2913024 RepID=UPI003D0D0FA1
MSLEAGHISDVRRDEPAVRASWSSPWWRKSVTLAVLWSVLLVYGGLVPFDLSWDRIAEPEMSSAEVLGVAVTAPLRWYQYPAWEKTTFGLPEWVADATINGMLFFPLGVLWMLFWRPRVGFNAGLGLSVLLAGLVSWGIESGQMFSVVRVSALNDAVVNIGAATLGALLALPARRGFLWVVFGSYRLWSPVIDQGLGLLRRVRGDAALRRCLIGGVVLLGLLMCAVLATVIDARGGVVPFAGTWARSYDLAATQMLLAGMGYGLVGLLTVGIIVRPRAESGWSRALMVVGLIAFGYELVRAQTAGDRLDFTLPLMAVGSVLAVMALGLAVVHGVRLACRRREVVSVPNDRRRREHDYGFGIGE